jgi:hypothetical protein
LGAGGGGRGAAQMLRLAYKSRYRHHRGRAVTCVAMLSILIPAGPLPFPAHAASRRSPERFPAKSWTQAGPLPPDAARCTSCFSAARGNVTADETLGATGAAGRRSQGGGEGGGGGGGGGEEVEKRWGRRRNGSGRGRCTFVPVIAISPSALLPPPAVSLTLSISATGEV